MFLAAAAASWLLLLCWGFLGGHLVCLKSLILSVSKPLTHRAWKERLNESPRDPSDGNPEA